MSRKQLSTENEHIPLDQAKLGQSLTLHSFTDVFIAKKLVSMGVLPGAKIRIVRKLWRGENFFLECNQQRIALRKAEAASIQVKWEK